MKGEWWVGIYEMPRYAVSSEGRVKRTAGGRGARSNYVLSQTINRDGYACVTLYHGGAKRGFLVNRLVCSAFHGPPAVTDWHAAHTNGDKTDNRASNLRWATRLENEADKEAHGTRVKGEAHGRSKLTEGQVKAIRADDRPQRAIASDYGITQGLISMLKNRKVWDHV